MKRTFCILSALSVFSLCALFAQTKKPAAKHAAGLAASAAAGKKIYNIYCLSCHQADGGGVANMTPPLIQTTYVLGDKGKLIKIILKGFSDNVEINGETYTNIMPAVSTLKDQEIADVLTYVRSNFTNKASAVTVADVRKIRGSK